MIPQVDTFPTYKRLLSVGITDKQAEVFIQSLRDLNEEFAKELVTRDEFNRKIDEILKKIEELAMEVKGLSGQYTILSQQVEKNTNDIADIKKEMAEIKAELKQFKVEIALQFQVLEQSIIIKMGGMLVIAVGVLFAMLKVFN